MFHTIAPSALSCVAYNHAFGARAGFELGIKSLSTNKKTCSNLIPDQGPKVLKSGALATVQWIAVVNGCPGVYCALVSKNYSS